MFAEAKLLYRVLVRSRDLSLSYDPPLVQIPPKSTGSGIAKFLMRESLPLDASRRENR